jgi:hypothetical protein
VRSASHEKIRSYWQCQEPNCDEAKHWPTTPWNRRYGLHNSFGSPHPSVGQAILLEFETHEGNQYSDHQCSLPTRNSALQTEQNDTD